MEEVKNIVIENNAVFCGNCHKGRVCNRFLGFFHTEKERIIFSELICEDIYLVNPVPNVNTVKKNVKKIRETYFIIAARFMRKKGTPEKPSTSGTMVPKKTISYPRLRPKSTEDRSSFDKKLPLVPSLTVEKIHDSSFIVKTRIVDAEPPSVSLIEINQPSTSKFIPNPSSSVTESQPIISRGKPPIGESDAIQVGLRMTRSVTGVKRMKSVQDNQTAISSTSQSNIAVVSPQSNPEPSMPQSNVTVSTSPSNLATSNSPSNVPTSQSNVVQETSDRSFIQLSSDQPLSEAGAQLLQSIKPSTSSIDDLIEYDPMMSVYSPPSVLSQVFFDNILNSCYETTDVSDLTDLLQLPEDFS